jgi:hypothetical protein
MTNYAVANFHYATEKATWQPVFTSKTDTRFRYRFENFFHPYVGQLITRLNQKSISGMLDASWQDSLAADFFASTYGTHPGTTIQIQSFPKEIDLAPGGPYANYNWELCFHVPLTIATHLSKNQRFAEAQKWFHFIFDPTTDDTSVPAPERYWRFLEFRKQPPGARIDELLRTLAKPAAECTREELQLREGTLQSYQAVLDRPFQPHAVARARVVPYQYSVVMKYLDNLISWGDSLFAQDTIETINEATQLYVLAANILGTRPQRVPTAGTTTAKTFRQLKDAGLDPTGNAFVELEGQFPLDLTLPQPVSDDSDGSAPLFGLGHVLYFCIPPNDRLFGYWDTVADRLYKIRNCLNIEGVFRQLALFDPPIDPGMLVKAAAAGVDISSVVAGLNSPVSPVRARIQIQQALSMASEVRSMGAALLSALEKQDGEKLAVLRQGHDGILQRMNREVRFLQLKQAREATEVLLKTRAGAVERYHAHLRLLGIAPDSSAVPNVLSLDRRALTEDNFDEAYSVLVGEYETAAPAPNLPALRLAQSNSPAAQSGAAGAGPLFLNNNEDLDLNFYGPIARDSRIAAQVVETVFGVLSLIPDMGLDLHYWGLGGHATLFGGSLFAGQGRFVSNVLNLAAAVAEGQGAVASKTAGYERRVDDWILQARTDAAEIAQNGRQVLASLIAEQAAEHEYQVAVRQIDQSDEVEDFLQGKFTNADLYGWMQGELSKSYYDYYRTALALARQAEQATKRELMRPEINNRQFVSANYWDGGRKGLLSGESLYLDVKSIELAYQEQNRRELELTRHISLRQLDPIALLNLKVTGSCDFAIPEALFDRDTPGHYLRRIKSVAVSIPSVVGPYTPLNATLTLQQSTIRTSSELDNNNYGRSPGTDDRFVDLPGSGASIVTSGGANDSGLFQTDLSDERPLPFEGAGAVSAWRLSLPKAFPAFDYDTIADVTLHMRYTARIGGALLGTQASKELRDLLAADNAAGLALLFGLSQEFASEWSAFAASTDDLSLTLRRDQFPYFTSGLPIAIDGIELYAATGAGTATPTLARRTVNVASTVSDDLNGDDGEATITVAPDASVLVRTPAHAIYLSIRYHLDL